MEPTRPVTTDLIGPRLNFDNQVGDLSCRIAYALLAGEIAGIPKIVMRRAPNDLSTARGGGREAYEKRVLFGSRRITACPIHLAG